LAQGNFGSRLAEARRRRGLTLEQVHVQLRITPAILEALELADFRHMPLKGHARNMVSSYARFLGLNPEELTKQFLKEYHEFENHEARQNSSPFASLSRDSTRHDAQQTTARFKNSENNRSSRSMWDHPIPNSELGKGYTSRPSTIRRMTSSDQDRRSHRDGSSSGSYSSDSYSAKPSLLIRIFGSLFKNPVVMIVFLIIVLVALLVLWAMAANSCKKQENEVIPINTSTVASDGDTTDGDNILNPPDNNGEVLPLYGPFELVIEPGPDPGAWIEVWVDGQEVYNSTLSEKLTYQVTQSCSIATWQPANVLVYRGDVEQEFGDSSDDGYYMSLEVVDRILNPDLLKGD